MDERGGERGPGILALAAPLVVSFWLRAAFTWVDTAYAAALKGVEGLSDASIAAIGLTFPFEFLMIACWVGTSNGLTSRFAAAMGARQGERMEQLKRATRRIIHVLCAAFVLIAAGIWWGAERFVPDPLTARQFQIYGTVLIGGSGFTMFWSILPDSIVKAHHDTRSTMWAGILSSLLNVALNTVFVFVFGMGIFGIAFSTVLGRLAGLVYALTRAAHHERIRVAKGQDDVPGVYARPVRTILSIALPGGAGFALLGLESLVINSILARSAETTSALAAWSIFDQATRLLAMPVIASGVAMLPLSARLFGRGDLRRIQSELNVVLRAFVVYVAVVVVPVALILGPRISALLSHAARTQHFAELGLRYVPLAVLAMAPLFPMRAAFEGMQLPRPGLYVALIRSFLLVIPLTLLGIQLAPKLGAEVMSGACIGFILGVGTATAIMALVLHRHLGRCIADQEAAASDPTGATTVRS